MDLADAASLIFERRKQHYSVCCEHVASNRDSLFWDLSIPELVFLGHHVSMINLNKALNIPRLSETIQAHIDKTKFDAFKGWYMFCNVQRDPLRKALVTLGKRLAVAMALANV